MGASISGGIVIVEFESLHFSFVQVFTSSLKVSSFPSPIRHLHVTDGDCGGRHHGYYPELAETRENQLDSTNYAVLTSIPKMIVSAPGLFVWRTRR